MARGISRVDREAARYKLRRRQAAREKWTDICQGIGLPSRITTAARNAQCAHIAPRVLVDEQEEGIVRVRVRIDDFRGQIEVPVKRFDEVTPNDVIAYSQANSRALGQAHQAGGFFYSKCITNFHLHPFSHSNLKTNAPHDHNGSTHRLLSCFPHLFLSRNRRVHHALQSIPLCYVPFYHTACKCLASFCIFEARRLLAALHAASLPSLLFPLPRCFDEGEPRRLGICSDCRSCCMVCI